MKNFKEELEYLKGYDLDESEKIKFIENLYKLAHLNHKDFMQEFDKSCIENNITS